MRTWSTRIAEWALKTFGQATPARALARFYEEFQEFESETNPRKKVEEAADLCITLATWAKSVGFDLSFEVLQKDFVNSRRKWVSRGDGTGYHVKDPERDAISRQLFQDQWAQASAISAAQPYKLTRRYCLSCGAEGSAYNRISDGTCERCFAGVPC